MGVGDFLEFGVLGFGDLLEFRVWGLGLFESLGFRVSGLCVFGIY